MRIIDTPDIGSMKNGATIDLWIYNALDCCLTSEVFGVLNSQMDEIARDTYDLSKRLMGPVLEMNMRGVQIDTNARDQLIATLHAEMEHLSSNLARLTGDGYGHPFSWSSPEQVKTFFYDYIGLKEIKKRDPKTGKMVRTSNRDALERMEVNHHVRPIISHILVLRDLSKQISTLRSLGAGDGRAYTNFNIAGTNTGRLSSAWGDFGSGGNLQNVDRRVRTLFVADPGMKFCNIDLEQADARNVGAICWELFGEDTFLNAAEAGDLHTTVARMTWRELDWPEEQAGWRAIADQSFYREDSYRQTAKKLGHGSNFNGQPPTMALHTKTPVAVIEDFQRRYFAAFPELRQRIEWVKSQLWEHGQITTLFGRRRHFFKRRGDPKTLNEACGYEPQSMTADFINNAMVRIFGMNIAQLLLQVHDSMLFQYPEDREEEIVPQLLEGMKVLLPLRGGREFYVPSEAKVGWNWGDAGKSNPLGLAKWKGSDPRTRSHG